jgi:hypothetical protein
MVKTLRKFSLGLENVPAGTSWFLADLGEAKGKHDPWPYINYVLFILKQAYREFEGRVGMVTSPKGTKTELVLSAIGSKFGPFRIADLQRQCPGVGIDMIRRILKNLKARGEIQCLGRGQKAKWQKVKNMK